MKNKIAEIRKAKGFTQIRLAQELNIDRSHLSSVETGKRKPSMMLLTRIAEKLGVSVKDFF